MIAPRTILVSAGLLAIASASAWATSPKNYIEDQYGPIKQWAVVSVSIDGEAVGFRVQVAKDRPRIIVEATDAAAEKAATGTLRKLSLGLLDKRFNPAPFEQAALQHLANLKRKGCALKLGGQIAGNRFEWSFECSSQIPVRGAKR